MWCNNSEDIPVTDLFHGILLRAVLHCSLKLCFCIKLFYIYYNFVFAYVYITTPRLSQNIVLYLVMMLNSKQDFVMWFN